MNSLASLCRPLASTARLGLRQPHVPMAPMAPLSSSSQLLPSSVRSIFQAASRPSVVRAFSAAVIERRSHDHDRGHDRGHDHGHKSKHGRATLSPWALAAAVPMVVVPGDAPTIEVDLPQRRPLSSYSGRDLPVDPELIGEISKGGLAGLVAGLLVSTFSKTLVLLLGVAISVQTLAARWGIDLVRYLHLKERLGPSRLLQAVQTHTVMKLAFGLTFTMSAFMYF